MGLSKNTVLQAVIFAKPPWVISTSKAWLKRKGIKFIRRDKLVEIDILSYTIVHKYRVKLKSRRIAKSGRSGVYFVLAEKK